MDDIVRSKEGEEDGVRNRGRLGWRETRRKEGVVGEGCVIGGRGR